MTPKIHLVEVVDEAAGIGAAEFAGMLKHDVGFIEGHDREGVARCRIVTMQLSRRARYTQGSCIILEVRATRILHQ